MHWQDFDFQTYADYAPGPCDARGLSLPDRQGWLVAASSHRDSSILEQSNWDCIERSLSAIDEDGVETYSFNHWAVGWVRVMLVDPTSDALRKDLAEILCALADYPVLDDMDYSERQNEEQSEQWEWMDTKDRLQVFRDHSYSGGSFAQLLAAVRGGCWHAAASMLHCPSDVFEAC